MYEGPQNLKLMSETLAKLDFGARREPVTESELRGLLYTACRVIEELELKVRNNHAKIDELSRRGGGKDFSF